MIGQQCISLYLCYFVPSSCIRLLATSVADPLHPALSLAYRLMLLMVAPLEYPMSVSSHLCLGLPLLLAPFILPSITSSSIPPALTTYPKYTGLQCPFLFDVLDYPYVCQSLPCVKYCLNKLAYIHAGPKVKLRLRLMCV